MASSDIRLHTFNRGETRFKDITVILNPLKPTLKLTEKCHESQCFVRLEQDLCIPSGRVYWRLPVSTICSKVNPLSGSKSRERRIALGDTDTLTCQYPYGHLGFAA